jgi:hypothetical protein
MRGGKTEEINIKQQNRKEIINIQGRTMGGSLERRRRDSRKS